MKLRHRRRLGMQRALADVINAPDGAPLPPTSALSIQASEHMEVLARLVGMHARMGQRYYRLDGTKPVPCSPMQMADALDGERHVGSTVIDDVWVSTIFLCLDHNMMGFGPPILFETAIFLPDIVNGGTVERYESWEEAERGHERACASVRAALARAGHASTTAISRAANGALPCQSNSDTIKKASAP